MSADYSRIHRLLKILTLIQSQTGWNAAKLAQECSTSERNIYRDMKMLEGAGIPYHFCTETNGYRIRRDFFLPPVDLTLEEALALLALGEAVGEREQLPMLQPARRAVQKIRGRLPARLLDAIGELDGAVRMKLAASEVSESIADVYEQVRSAIVSTRALRCGYESQTSVRNGQNEEAGSATEVFLFRPYRLMFNQRAWYAIGHHEGRGALRCLKLNRFTRCEPTDQPYVIPQDFRLEDHLGHAWRMIRGAQRYEVALRFDASFAETIADTHWHDTQQIEWLEDGCIIFRCTVDGLDEILWWVLGMGPHCRVQAPQELADRVKAAAQEMLQQYER